MTQFLPDNLLALFEARPPLPYKPPPDDLLVDRKRPKMQGVSQFVHLFEDPKDTPPKAIFETKEQRRARRRKEKEELLAYKIEQGIATWNPTENTVATMDPYKTLFVARINYETSESKLRREFEQYGKVQKLLLVHDKSGKPRGYAFVEYQKKEDMSEAYKKADGTKIDGRRVVVDYERGRTQKTWLPRRLGGGKGDTRRTRESKAALEAAALERGPDDRERRSSSTTRSFSRDRERDREGRDRGDRDRERGDRDKDRERNGGARHRSRSRERDRGRETSDRGSRDAPDRTREPKDRRFDDVRGGRDRGAETRDYRNGERERDFRGDRERRRY